MPKETVPKRPPKMKYTDLPLYTAPHSDYRTYIKEQIRCPKAYDKLIHQWLLPHVKSSRKWVSQNWSDFSTEVASLKKDALTSFHGQKNLLIKYMRAQENLNIRRGIITAGGVAGFYISTRKGGGFLRGLFWTGAGLLATGSLCFPKESDEAFRTLTYTAAKVVIAGYNLICCRGFSLRERISCKSELPVGVKSETEAAVIKKCKEKVKIDVPKACR